MQKVWEKEAIKLVKFHLSNGDISLWKFKFFLEIIKENNTYIIPNLDELIKNYGELVFNQLLSCEIATKLFELRRQQFTQTGG